LFYFLDCRLPLFLLPLLLFYWFLLKPTVDRMKADGSWDKNYGDVNVLYVQWVVPLRMTWEYLMGLVGLEADRGEL